MCHQTSNLLKSKVALQKLEKRLKLRLGRLLRILPLTQNERKHPPNVLCNTLSLECIWITFSTEQEHSWICIEGDEQCEWKMKLESLVLNFLGFLELQNLGKKFLK